MYYLCINVVNVLLIDILLLISAMRSPWINADFSCPFTFISTDRSSKKFDRATFFIGNADDLILPLEINVNYQTRKNVVGTKVADSGRELR